MEFRDQLALSRVRWRMEQSAAQTRHQMKRHLRGLSTVAFLAPMVGLLGTCAGVVDAFRVCWAPSVFRAIFGGLAEGFVPLAAGLAVGLPAFWAYRHLHRQAEDFELEMARTTEQLLEYLQLR